MMLAGLEWRFDDPLVIVALAVVALATMLSLVLAGRRLASRNLRRWLVVIGLNLLAAVSLALLVSPPLVPRTAGEGALLVTEGADPTTLPAARSVLTLPGAPRVHDRSGSVRELLDAGQLGLQSPVIDQLSVVGHGLDATAWNRVPEDITVTADLKPLSGPVDVQWSRQLDPGQPLGVTGRVLAPGHAGAVHLELVDPAGQVAANLDLVPGQGFWLEDVPAATGRMTYRLVMRAGDSTWNEPVTTWVRTPPAARIVVIQSAPSFETRQLKNWAADRRAEVTVLSQISRDISTRESVNRAPSAPGLSPTLLAGNDLLVLDGRSLAELSPERLAWIEQAVASGLGVLVLVDQDLASWLPGATAPWNQFQLTAERESTGDAIPDFPGADSERALARVPWRLDGDAGVLLRGLDGETLSTTARFGQGRVALSVLRERHRWLTAGEGDVFSRYWAWLLARLARPRAAPYALPPAPGQFDRVGQQGWWCAQSDGRMLTATLQDAAAATQLVPVRDLTGSDRWCAASWPAQAGWVRVQWFDAASGAAVATSDRYVFAAGEWLSVQRNERQRATRERSIATSQAQAARHWKEPLSPLWPFMAFLLAAGGMWWERKRDDG